MPLQAQTTYLLPVGGRMMGGGNEMGVRVAGKQWGLRDGVRVSQSTYGPGMKGSDWIGVISSLTLMLTFGACTSERQDARPEGATAQQIPQPGGMMGGGGMMRAGGVMRGREDTAAAPHARAAAGSAAGCPNASQTLVDEGREIFTGQGNCYACHGGNAKGTPVAPDLTDSTWLNIDGSYGAIASLVHRGVPHPKQFPSAMPAMGGAQLDSLQVCAVAAYVYSLSR